MKAYFFGCVYGSGHHLHNEDLTGTRGYPLGFHIGLLDHNLLTQAYGKYARQKIGDTVFACVQTSQGPFAVLSLWDRSQDKREGSNCAFIFEGEHTVDETLALVKERFASVFEARFGQVELNIKEVQVPSATV